MTEIIEKVCLKQLSAFCKQFAVQLEKIDTQLRFAINAFPEFKEWDATSVFDDSQRIVRVTAGMLGKAIVKQESEITELQTERDRYKVALEFYANKSSYRFPTDGRNLIIDCSPIEDDGGHLAREALNPKPEVK